MKAASPTDFDWQVGSLKINDLGATFSTDIVFLTQKWQREIRDLEIAEMAMQAAPTGHLVFSTLHTSDSAGAVTHLLDLGVPAYLIGSTLIGFRSRCGLLELLGLDEGVRGAICERPDLAELRQGLTTLDEALRATPDFAV